MSQIHTARDIITRLFQSGTYPGKGGTYLLYALTLLPYPLFSRGTASVLRLQPCSRPRGVDTMQMQEAESQGIS